MEFEQFIADLLIKNNCVIVPKFGGFIANYKPAFIDSIKRAIYPPSKNVLFNPNLISNDGLLANYISEKSNISYQNSIGEIDIRVQDWKSKLAEGKRIEIGEIGFLFENEGNICFEQNREFNILLQAYGLSSVKFLANQNGSNRIKKVEKNDAAKVEHKIEFATALFQEPNSDDSKRKVIPINAVVNQPKKSKKWKYLAVACILPALFYSYWIPMNTSFLENGNVQISDFNPLNSQASKEYSARQNKIDYSVTDHVNEWDVMTKNINSKVKYYNYQFSEELYIPVDLTSSTHTSFVTEPADNDLINETIQVVESQTISSSTNSVFLIAGCFSSESNANVLVDELKSKGYKALIVDKNKGLYRVAAESFNTLESANDVKSKLSLESISTWVLKK